MLIITRKRGESTDLLDRSDGTVLATITVLGMSGDGQVRLGFEAHSSIRILRDNAIRRDYAQENDTNGNR